VGSTPPVATRAIDELECDVSTQVSHLRCPTRELVMGTVFWESGESRSLRNAREQTRRGRQLWVETGRWHVIWMLARLRNYWGVRIMMAESYVRVARDLQKQQR